MRAFAAPVDSPERLVVNAITFSGNSAFDDATLDALIASQLGRALSLDDLRSLASQVAQYYHQKGYFLAQVVIPQQDFAAEAGTVRFVVLEGRLGQVVVSGDEPYASRRVRPAFAALKPGEPLQKAQLERVLVALNDDAGANVVSVLRAGSTQGATDVYVQVKAKPSLGISLGLNNYGADASGMKRASANVTLSNPSGRGDRLGLGLSGSLDASGNAVEQADYQLPWGASGLRLNAHLSTGRYALSRQYSGLEVVGSRSAWGVGFTYPYALRPNYNLSYSAAFESVDAGQSVLRTPVAQDRIRKLQFGLSIEKRDAVGRTLFDLTLGQGLGPAFGGMTDSSLSSRSYAGADDSFTKWTFDLQRLRWLQPRLYVSGRISGQLSSAPLVAGEQWSIGGVDSVRGFAESSYSGDDGLVVNLEADYALGADGRVRLAGFADYGQASNKRPAVGMEPAKRLFGAGVGLRAQVGGRLDLRLDWGVPLGEDAGQGSRIYAGSTLTF